MKDFYDGWPVNFVASLEELRELDAASISDPLYAERKGKIRTAIQSWLIPQLSNVTRSEFDGIAVRLCEMLKIAPEIYHTSALNYVICIASSDNTQADKYLDQLMRPAVWAYRIREIPRRAGRRGGSHGNRHKDEALAIAVRFRQRNPDVVRSRLIQVVTGELSVKYTDLPHNSTIRRWLKTIYENN
nr:hypothetical protein [Salmonella enterica]